MERGGRIRLSAPGELLTDELYLFLLVIDTPDYAIEFMRDATADAMIAHVSRIDLAAPPEGNLILFGDADELAVAERAPNVVGTMDWPARPGAIRRMLARASRWLQRERHFRALANSDALTGLLNRRGFDETASRAVARARIDGVESSVLLIDADYFKQVNDRHGHAAGDALLRNIGRLISELVRAGDIAGRIGGEEMAVVMPGATLDTALKMAERLRAAIAAAVVPFGDEEIRATVSVGVATTRDAISHAPALRSADEALYLAKSRGRNRVVCAPVRSNQAAVSCEAPAIPSGGASLLGTMPWETAYQI